jgi:multidrug resistance efflux pump
LTVPKGGVMRKEHEKDRAKDTAHSEGSGIGHALRKEEKLLEGEVKKEARGMAWFVRSHTFRVILATVLFAITIFMLFYLNDLQGKVYIEKAGISAPIISLSSPQGGVLESIYVREGDMIAANTIVARVAGVPVSSKIYGLVISVQDTPGQLVSAQTPIVQMIDPSAIRLVGRVEEDKGLSDIRVGQKAVFTVDAFGQKEYTGTVESIGQTSRQSDIVFSISDKRQENEFEVKVKFDAGSYPELKNGMSARLWIYK